MKNFTFNKINNVNTNFASFKNYDLIMMGMLNTRTIIYNLKNELNGDDEFIKFLLTFLSLDA